MVQKLLREHTKSLEDDMKLSELLKDEMNEDAKTCSKRGHFARNRTQGQSRTHNH